MRLWRRRRTSRELGAAVTGIPSAAVPVRSLAPAPVPEQPPSPAAPVAPVAAPAPVAEVVTAAPVAPPSAVGPRVELGFRDGTSASLDPASEQARALEELARALTLPS